MDDYYIIIIIIIIIIMIDYYSMDWFMEKEATTILSTGSKSSGYKNRITKIQVISNKFSKTNTIKTMNKINNIKQDQQDQTRTNKITQNQQD